MSALNSCMGNRTPAFAERAEDFYPTPPVAVEALLEVEEIPDGIYEPAAATARSSRCSGRPAAK